MVIKITDETLNHYKAIIENVANTYQNSLISHVPFDAKLSALTVKVTLEETKISWGVSRKAGNIYIIVLGINPRCGDIYNTFIIAHEFAHLLFARISDTIGIVGTASDGSKPFTNIIRVSSDGSLWGEEFEEQCADIVALWILKKLNISADDFLKNDLKKTKYKRYFVEAFTNSFGKSLGSLTYLDEYETNDKFQGNPLNAFWYFVINSSLSELITLYNARTIDNAFYNIVRLVESHENLKNQNFVAFKYAS